MFRTLRTRLLVYFITISLIGISLVSLTIFVGFKDIFKAYLEDKRVQQIQRVINLLKDDYHRNGVLTGDTVKLIMEQQAFNENIFYVVFDSTGKPITSSTQWIRLSGVENAKEKRIQLTSDQFPIEVDVEYNRFKLDDQIYPYDYKTVGYLKVFYPVNYAKTDFIFIHEFTSYIYLAVITMISFAVVLSFILARNLTSGLRQIKRAAQELMRHNYSVQIPNNLEIEEMKELAIVVNELAQSLDKLTKLRKQFTNDLAHELRTPLATLRSQLEAIMDGVWKPTPERIRQCYLELMRLVRLVNDLEKLIEAENPTIVLHYRQLEANEMIHLLKENFAPFSFEKNIEIYYDEPPQNIYFEADYDRLMQILTNLIHNAIKYTQNGGKIFLSVKQVEDHIQFVVEDNGPGIHQEDLPYLFERFYRGEKSRNRETGGVGIGLSIVKALIEAHKGEINIESELERGTKVTFLLPIKNPFSMIHSDASESSMLHHPA